MVCNKYGYDVVAVFEKLLNIVFKFIDRIAKKGLTISKFAISIL
jgi:hypothetical protein